LQALRPRVIAAANGRSERYITNDPSLFSTRPAWSPDGTMIAASQGYHGSGIVLLDRRGTELTQIPNLPGTFNSDPAWSPDGRWIAFSADAPLDLHGVYVVRIDGSGLRLLARDAYAPSWSPDGKRIAFARGMSYPAGEIALVNADGTDERLLTNTAALEGAPAWSPDGTLIAYSRRSGSTSVVMTMRPDGSDQQVVFDGPYEESDPAWRAVALGPPGARPCSLQGSSRDDLIRGSPYSDLIIGGGGNDRLIGGGGNDTLIGGRGHDDLQGGPGIDNLFLADHASDSADGGSGYDLTVFDRGLDRLEAIEERIRGFGEQR
jgi:dipeptidyl aminopeptidase/acylaminoacyl peptidase